MHELHLLMTKFTIPPLRASLLHRDRLLVGLVASLLCQALRGQSLIAPDALTWLTWIAVVALTLGIGGAIVLHARLSTAH